MTGDRIPTPDTPPTPEQIRCAADGEMLPEGADQTGPVPTSGPAGEAIRFEQELRSAVGRVMRETHAPAGLADRIRAAMAEAPETDAIHVDDARAGLVGHVSSTPAPAAAATSPDAEPDASRFSFTRWLESPRRANAAAVAAVLALVIGAIGFGIVMPTISEWSDAPASRFVEQAATFAANEHGRCSSQRVRTDKLTEFTDMASAQSFLSRHLNRPVESVRLPDLTAEGYEFVGVAACHLPGGLPSAHAVWRSTEASVDGVRPLVSGFVTLDRNQFELQDAMAADIRVSGVELADGTICSRTVRVFRDGGLAFLIVSCKEEALEGCTQRMAGAFGG